MERIAYEIMCELRWRLKKDPELPALRALWDIACANRAEAEKALREQLGLLPPDLPGPTEPYLIERVSREKLIAGVERAIRNYQDQENDE